MSRAELAADARVLWRLLRGQSRRGSHADRLTDFYAPQAERYDHFRARLLHGRDDLMAALKVPAGARVVELGAGTGSNLDLLAAARPLDRLGQVTLVDLCPPLLAVARRRAAPHANVAVVEADATRWQPDQPMDRVYFSYALTMIPDWRAAIDNALAMLGPGGRLGVVDFHLPEDGGRLGNAFWRRWFGHDGVNLSAEHVRYLRARCPTHRFQARRGAVPYLPGLRAPYYLFVGIKAG